MYIVSYTLIFHFIFRVFFTLVHFIFYYYILFLTFPHIYTIKRHCHCLEGLGRYTNATCWNIYRLIGQVKCFFFAWSFQPFLSYSCWRLIGLHVTVTLLILHFCSSSHLALEKWAISPDHSTTGCRRLVYLWTKKIYITVDGIFAWP